MQVPMICSPYIGSDKVLEIGAVFKGEATVYRISSDKDLKQSSRKPFTDKIRGMSPHKARG